jgi:hypothetical protein
VLKDFELTSSVPDFQCAAIDELRRHDVFTGSYSCNGDTIDVISGGVLGVSSDRRGIMTLLFSSMVAGLSIML